MPERAAGLRLDRALADPGFWPEFRPTGGLRTWRRLCAAGQLLLDGLPAKAGTRLRAGQLLLLRPSSDLPPELNDRNPLRRQPDAHEEDDPPRLIRRNADLAAIYKPRGLHSVALPGGGASLEARLPDLLAPSRDSSTCLLNRLDQGTSGLVLAACSPAGRAIWRQAEQEGLTDKRYLALVRGWPASDTGSGDVWTLRSALDTARRRRTRVLSHENPDPRRHTEVRFLASLPAGFLENFLSALGAHVREAGQAGNIALIACRIRQGARHQIRAHLAAFGHPLPGDPLYDPLCNKEDEDGHADSLAQAPGFFLHHGACSLPGFAASCPPFWLPLLPPEAAASASAWLEI